MVTESDPACSLLHILFASPLNPSYFLNNDPSVQVSRQHHLSTPHTRHVPRASHVHPWASLTPGCLQRSLYTHTYNPEVQES